MQTKKKKSEREREGERNGHRWTEKRGWAVTNEEPWKECGYKMAADLDLNHRYRIYDTGRYQRIIDRIIWTK